MGTHRQPFDLKDSWPDRPVSRLATIVEGCSGLARDPNEVWRQHWWNFSYSSQWPKVLPFPKPIRALSSSLTQESSRNDPLPGSHEDSEERLFVFRILEISNGTEAVGSKPLIFENQHLPHLGRSWRVTCKTSGWMGIEFNNVNDSRAPTTGTAPVSARPNIRAV